MSNVRQTICTVLNAALVGVVLFLVVLASAPATLEIISGQR